MPDIHLTGVLDSDLVKALIELAVIVTICVVVILITLHVTDRELDISLKPFHFGTHPRGRQSNADELRARLAMKRIGDLEEAMAAIHEATDAQLSGVLGRWFTYLCENLSHVLAAGTHSRYRIAIWTSDQADTTHLLRLAMHGFDRNDRRMDGLERATTVAGWAMTNRQQHYVKDTRSDLIYRPRRTVQDYRSMIAVPIGAADDPWAVITVDVDEIDGLDPMQRELVVRFGVLASTAARIGTRALPEDTTPSTAERQ